MWYYYSEEGSQGPFEEEALRAAFQAGQLPPETYVYTEGMEDWMTAEDAGMTGLPIPPIPEAPPSSTPESGSPPDEKPNEAASRPSPSTPTFAARLGRFWLFRYRIDRQGYLIKAGLYYLLFIAPLFLFPVIAPGYSGHPLWVALSVLLVGAHCCLMILSALAPRFRHIGTSGAFAFLYLIPGFGLLPAVALLFIPGNVIPPGKPDTNKDDLQPEDAPSYFSSEDVSPY